MVASRRREGGAERDAAAGACHRPGRTLDPGRGARACRARGLRRRGLSRAAAPAARLARARGRAQPGRSRGAARAHRRQPGDAPAPAGPAHASAGDPERAHRGAAGRGRAAAHRHHAAATTAGQRPRGQRRALVGVSQPRALAGIGLAPRRGSAHRRRAPAGARPPVRPARAGVHPSLGPGGAGRGDPAAGAQLPLAGARVGRAPAELPGLARRSGSDARLRPAAAAAAMAAVAEARVGPPGRGLGAEGALPPGVPGPAVPGVSGRAGGADAPGSGPQPALDRQHVRRALAARGRRGRRARDRTPVPRALLLVALALPRGARTAAARALPRRRLLRPAVGPAGPGAPHPCLRGTSPRPRGRGDHAPLPVGARPRAAPAPRLHARALRLHGPRRRPGLRGLPRALRRRARGLGGRDLRAAAWRSRWGSARPTCWPRRSAAG
jgi:hypothetical protein